MLDILYSLDIVGWKERILYHTNVHWHYREVKAIDEMYKAQLQQAILKLSVLWDDHQE